MGSSRSRKAKAQEQYNYQIEEIFEQIAEDREGSSAKPETRPVKDNPNHPCYKCIGCVRWTRCVGYYQLLECIEQRKQAYERRLAQ